jgi:hypothetical protein
LTATVTPALLHEARPLNVVMVVMESVGTRDLGLYGAPYKDTPQLERLAAHSAQFDRVFVAQGNTSAAMTALFCSLYPRLAWFPVPRWRPDLAAVGLPALLAQHGYATGFLDSGSIGEDRRAEFLLDHGCGVVAAEHRDPRLPQDGRCCRRPWTGSKRISRNRSSSRSGPWIPITPISSRATGTTACAIPHSTDT